jgi:hypothetical protein
MVDLFEEDYEEEEDYHKGGIAVRFASSSTRLLHGNLSPKKQSSANKTEEEEKDHSSSTVTRHPSAPVFNDALGSHHRSSSHADDEISLPKLDTVVAFRQNDNANAAATTTVDEDKTITNAQNMDSRGTRTGTVGLCGQGLLFADNPPCATNGGDSTFPSDTSISLEKSDQRISTTVKTASTITGAQIACYSSGNDDGNSSEDDHCAEARSCVKTATKKETARNPLVARFSSAEDAGANEAESNDSEGSNTGPNETELFELNYPRFEHVRAQISVGQPISFSLSSSLSTLTANSCMTVATGNGFSR